MRAPCVRTRPSCQVICCLTGPPSGGRLSCSERDHLSRTFSRWTRIVAINPTMTPVPLVKSQRFRSQHRPRATRETMVTACPCYPTFSREPPPDSAVSDAAVSARHRQADQRCPRRASLQDDTRHQPESAATEDTPLLGEATSQDLFRDGPDVEVQKRSRGIRWGGSLVDCGLRIQKRSLRVSPY